MEMKKNKRLVIFSLLIFSAILIAGVFIFVKKPQNENTPQDIKNIVQNVTPDEITEVPVNTAALDIMPNEILPTDIPKIIIAPSEILPVETSAENEMNTEIILTVMPEMPEAPELPDTAFRGERTGNATPEDAEAHKALDPALTNPDVKPDIHIAAVQPDKPNDDTHLWWTINENGELYAPGFGWIQYTGENIMHQSESDGDWDRQIGSMN
ncbi:MAG: hypothetical protein FWD23_18760 [Oscillospiraceae bacterium]|nr:hypothetical protein [Oscillospiraceae bacterium]